MKQRKDGRFQSQVYIGMQNGKRKYKTVYANTQKELKKKVAELRVDLGKGVDIAADMSFKTWADRYLAVQEDKQTFEYYRTVSARAEFFKRCFDGYKIDKISPADVEAVLRMLANENPVTHKPSARKTVNEYLTVLRGIFAYALRSRVLTFDPTNGITLPKTPPKAHREALTRAQVEAIKNTPHEMQLPTLLMLYAGLREGECIALTWSDIDFEHKRITVNKSYNQKSKQIKTPKTDAGTRTVPLLKVLEPYLLDAPKESMLVCTHNGNKIKGAYTGAVWAHEMQKYQKLLGFEFLSHSCRHTFATMLYEANVDEMTAAKIFGHADTGLMRETYTHLREEQELRSKLAMIENIS